MHGSTAIGRVSSAELSRIPQFGGGLPRNKLTQLTGERRTRLPHGGWLPIIIAMPHDVPPFADSLPFELVSFDAAREALEQPPAGVRALRPRGMADWIARRRPLTEAERRLSRAAAQWMLSLPTGVRPMELVRRFPRLANTLCASWGDSNAALQVLDGLVMDRRGGRQGFPRDIAAELVALRDHLVRRMRLDAR